MIASMAAVNFNNSNYLASVVCPYTWLDSLNSEKIGEPDTVVAWIH